MAVTMPQARRRPKYLPRLRWGTTSAIQLVHAGPPTACPLYIRKIRPRNTNIARCREAESPPRQWISPSGTRAIGIHINRWKYRPIKKMRFRLPVASINRLAGNESSAVTNGRPARMPNSNLDAPRHCAKLVWGVPAMVLAQTDPKSQATVPSHKARRRAEPRTFSG